MKSQLHWEYSGKYWCLTSWTLLFYGHHQLYKMGTICMDNSHTILFWRDTSSFIFWHRLHKGSQNYNKLTTGTRKKGTGKEGSSSKTYRKDWSHCKSHMTKETKLHYTAVHTRELVRPQKRGSRAISWFPGIISFSLWGRRPRKIIMLKLLAINKLCTHKIITNITWLLYNCIYIIY